MKYVYCFYWHLNPDFPANKIVKAIEQKNWDYFSEQMKIWGTFYLPKYIFVHEGDNVDDIPMNKENFYKIEHCEYECG